MRTGQGQAVDARGQAADIGWRAPSYSFNTDLRRRGRIPGRCPPDRRQRSARRHQPRGRAAPPSRETGGGGEISAPSRSCRSTGPQVPSMSTTTTRYQGQCAIRWPGCSATTSSILHRFLGLRVIPRTTSPLFFDEQQQDAPGRYGQAGRGRARPALGPGLLSPDDRRTGLPPSRCWGRPGAAEGGRAGTLQPSRSCVG